MQLSMVFTYPAGLDVGAALAAAVVADHVPGGRQLARLSQIFVDFNAELWRIYAVGQFCKYHFREPGISIFSCEKS